MSRRLELLPAKGPWNKARYSKCKMRNPLSLAQRCNAKGEPENRRYRSPPKIIDTKQTATNCLDINHVPATAMTATIGGTTRLRLRSPGETDVRSRMQTRRKSLS